MNPEPCPERLSIWPGFNFKCGETWAVWTRDRAGTHLYWSARGFYFRSTDEYPELVQAFLEVRPYGGRMYITEHGHVWINLPKNQVSDACAAPFARKIAEFMDSTSAGTRDVILRLVTERLGATGCWPVYLGHISEFDSGSPPRTFYKDISAYQDTSDPETADEDPFDSDSWRKMMR
jgi:hypothetical protein